MTSARFIPTLGLILVLFTACSPSAKMPQTPAATATLAPTATPEPPPFRVVAYATEAVIESVIPYDKLTHINYSFIIPNADGTFKPILNRSKLHKIVENGHKEDVKVLISVGGWGWEKEFETVAADPKLRSEFVQNLKAFVDEYQLDGVDIDWEYPDAGASSENFLVLIKELREAMPDKLITSAVVAYGDDSGMGIPQESFDVMDYLVVMAYSGSDHAEMAQFEKGIQYWKDRGLPKDKLVIGLPFYSEPNGVPYFKLVKLDPSAAQSDSFDYYGTFENYNGIPTIQEKTRIAMEQTGGVAIWALEHDTQGETSLVNAIWQLVSR